MKRKRIILRTMMAMPVCISLRLACAQDTLHLEDAAKAALENNYDIRIARNNSEVNALQYEAAKDAVFPVVNATGSDVQEFNSIHQQYSNGNETNKSGAGVNNLSVGVEAGIPLFNGFKLYATKNQMESLMREGEINLNEEIQNTLANVETQYERIVAEQNYLQVLKQDMDVSQKQLDIAHTRKEAGLGDQSEVYLAGIALNNSMEAVQQEKLLIRQLMTDLNTLMQFPADSEFVPEDTIHIDTALQYAAFLDLAKQNPGYTALDFSISASRWSEKAINASRLPSLSLNGGYNFFLNRSDAGFFLVNQNFGPYIGVTLNIPIYNAGLYKNQADVAHLNTQNLQLQQDALLQDVESGLYKTWSAYDSNLKQIETSRSTMEMAQKNLALELLRYKLNEATIIELNQAQQQFDAAAYAYLELLFSVKSSEIELHRLTGTLQ